MTITLPELVLVVLVGPSGSGKSTFARRHFKPTEILSSDHFRAMIADDENEQSVTFGAFELLYLTAAKRLAHGRLTVIDATNVKAASRKECLELARRYHVQIVAIVFDLPEELCTARAAGRAERPVPASIVQKHANSLRHSIRMLESEGFKSIHAFSTPEEVDAVTVVRERLPVNRREETGPFDLIGDVHGCIDEFKELLDKLGYGISESSVTPPEGRKLVLVGDLVDRGPDSPGVLRLVMQMVEAGTALCVRGNHDDKLLRKLQGREITIGHGLAETLEQLAKEPPEFVERMRLFLESLPTHYVLDGGKLIVAHAGLKEYLHGRVSDRVRAFALYGDTTGENDEHGLPIRLNWAEEYKGRAMVVYGHTPKPVAEWQNNTICIDTGCAFGGRLTALRYPERELVSVDARRQYAVPKKPMAEATSLGEVLS